MTEQINKILKANNFDVHKMNKSLEKALLLEFDEKTVKEFREGFFELVEFKSIDLNRAELKYKSREISSCKLEIT